MRRRQFFRAAKVWVVSFMRYDLGLILVVREGLEPSTSAL